MRVTCLFLTMVLFTAIPFVSVDSEGTSQTVVLYSLCPTGDSEGFSLFNPTLEDINIKGYRIEDNNGYVEFTFPTVLSPNSALWIVAAEPEDWMKIENFILIGEKGIISDKFSLTDKGDTITLKNHKGDIIDSVSYGDIGNEEADMPKVPKKSILKRNSAYGFENETEKWIITVPGRTDYHFQRNYDAKVSPFSFPENGNDSVLAALSTAEKSVLISMYTFENKLVTSVLLNLLENGVKVTMLMEGSPVGGINDTEISLLSTLNRAGAEIIFLISNDGYKRYDYNHSKYCVIDSSYVIITSENWTDTAFSENRGWGIIIDSKEYAEYLSEVFNYDLKGIDTINFSEKYPTSIPSPIPSKKYIGELKWTKASITSVLSPDYSDKSLINILKTAKDRLYIQQLDIDFDWIYKENWVFDILSERGENGADVRLLVDVTYDNPNDNDNNDGYGVYNYFKNSDAIDIRYNTSNNYGLMHNKGIISDNSVWIGSMNWTESSVFENREVSIIIESEIIADYYAQLYLNDWGIEFNGTTELKINKYENGYKTTYDASESIVPFGSAFHWDTDGDGITDKTGKSITLYESKDVTLIVIDENGNEYSETIYANQTTSDTTGFPEGPIKYIPLIVICALIIITKYIWRMKSK